MSYVYVKKAPDIHKRKHVDPRTKRILAFSFLGIGIILFASAVLPIIKYQLEYSIKFAQIVSPLSSKYYNNSSILGEMSTDYTQLSNWFVDDPTTQQNTARTIISSSGPQTYTISIPKLKIEDATVTLGSMDLKKSLIQYPQTALPGQAGNAVIFGHSVLPQFFNPKSYLTIFANLFKLKTGDEIYVDYDNVKYKYLVEEIFEVVPTDLSVLEQRFDGRYMSLITCTPPGTYLRRLVIKSRIVEM